MEVSGLRLGASFCNDFLPFMHNLRTYILFFGALLHVRKFARRNLHEIYAVIL